MEGLGMNARAHSPGAKGPRASAVRARTTTSHVQPFIAASAPSPRGSKHHAKAIGHAAADGTTDRHLPAAPAASPLGHKDAPALCGIIYQHLHAIQAETRKVESLVNLLYSSASSGRDATTAGTGEMGSQGPAEASRHTELSQNSLPETIIGRGPSLPGAVEGLRMRNTCQSNITFASSKGSRVLPANSLQRDLDVGKKQERRLARHNAEKVIREMHRLPKHTPGISRRQQESVKNSRKGGKHSVFPDATLMKERVRDALKKKDTNLSCNYADEGMWPIIARHRLFHYCTMFMIAFNVLWIAYDTDNNKAIVLFQAPLICQVAEHIFCAYFCAEWVIRLFACEYKWHALQDIWFVFDSFLLVMMILETWLINAIFAIFNLPTEHGGVFGWWLVFWIIRYIRFMRMARLVRLLRTFPDLFVLVKGLASAARSVALTLTLLLIIIYMFAIGFRHVTMDTAIGEKHFQSVPHSVVTLLLMGTLPDQAGMVQEVGAANAGYAVLFVLFILMGTFTVMNMLVGVLVEVVSVVSAVEKEEMTVNFLKNKLIEMMDYSTFDMDGNGLISKHEFDSLCLRVDAVKMLQDVGVDVVALVDLSEFIFKDQQELTFADFCEIILQFRGSNHATVKNIVDMRKFVVSELDELFDDLTSRELVFSEMLDRAFSEFQGKIADMTLSSGHRGQLSQLADQPVAPPPLPSMVQPPACPDDSQRKASHESAHLRVPSTDLGRPGAASQMRHSAPHMISASAWSQPRTSTFGTEEEAEEV